MLANMCLEQRIGNKVIAAERQQAGALVNDVVGVLFD